MPNISLNKKAAPELIQHNCTPKTIAEKAYELIEKPEVYQQQKDDFSALVSQLGKPGVNDRVAQMVMKILKEKNEEK